jgi:hypothetical protein
LSDSFDGLIDNCFHLPIYLTTILLKSQYKIARFKRLNSFLFSLFCLPCDAER